MLLLLFRIALSRHFIGLSDNKVYYFLLTYGISEDNQGQKQCMSKHSMDYFFNTPQPLYNTIVRVQANFRVSYPNRVITRVKCIVI